MFVPQGCCRIPRAQVAEWPAQSSHRAGVQGGRRQPHTLDSRHQELCNLLGNWILNGGWEGLGVGWACPALTLGGAGAHGEPEGTRDAQMVPTWSHCAPAPTARQDATASLLTPQPATAHCPGEGRELSLSLAETLPAGRKEGPPRALRGGRAPGA